MRDELCCGGCLWGGGILHSKHSLVFENNEYIFQRYNFQ
jgi:hypothetical protein